MAVKLTGGGRSWALWVSSGIGLRLDSSGCRATSDAARVKKSRRWYIELNQISLAAAAVFRFAMSSGLSDVAVGAGSWLSWKYTTEGFFSRLGISRYRSERFSASLVKSM